MRRIALSFLLLATLLVALPAAAAPVRPSRASVAPRRPAYVRLGDWARANEFSLQRPDAATLLLSKNSARLKFNIDPRQDLRKAQINGVNVWLAFPLVLQNGSVFIAQTDLENTLGPALWPPANSSGRKIKTICLDAGHGGKDPGYQVGSHEEKRYTLLLAQEVREQLRTAGFNVILTRTTDVYVDRAARPDLARRRNADLFVSLHYNAFPSSAEVRGVETYCLTPSGAFSTNAGGEGDTRPCEANGYDEKNFQLAYQLQKAIVKNLQLEDRGVKRARFEVLREATVPAILIEGGFMSNPAEGKKIFDPAYRKQMAKAIVEGIVAYQKAVKG